MIELSHHCLCWGSCRHCSGNYEAWRASGRKYEAQIAIFRILAAVDRFSWISWKVESCWGKLESRWGKQKAVEESRKPLVKVGKPLRKIGFRAKKIGFWARKISIFPKKFSSFWQFWGLVLLQDLLPRVQMDLLCWTQVLTTKIKSSYRYTFYQRRSEVESTAVWLPRTSGHEAELVGTFLPTFYFSWLLASWTNDSS